MLTALKDKKLYTAFWKQHGDIPVFSSPWWLDCTAGEGNWDVILVEDDGLIVCSFPYVINKGRIHTSLSMPSVTQKLGPYIVYPEAQKNEYKRIEYENYIFECIISALPKYDLFNINFDCKYRNWLEFYWNGFQQTSRYTYRIEDLKENTWFDAFEKSKKKKIKKGEKQFYFKQDLDVDAFYNYFEEVIKSRNEEVVYNRDFFRKLYSSVYEKKAGKSFYCLDKETGAIAAIKFLVWDSETAYDIIGIRKKEYNSSGSTEYLTYKCVEFCSAFVDCFDFEGSMVKGVEDAYRGYGTRQTEYYNISKDNRNLVLLLSDCKKVLNRIIHK